MDRQLIAYLLLAVLLLAVAASIAYAFYNTHERRYRRQQARERAAYKQRVEQSGQRA